MRRTVGGIRGRTQRLAQHLSTEHALTDQIAADASVDIFFKFFQAKQFNQFLSQCIHAGKPMSGYLKIKTSKIETAQSCLFCHICRLKH